MDNMDHQWWLYGLVIINVNLQLSLYNIVIFLSSEFLAALLLVSAGLVLPGCPSCMDSNPQLKIHYIAGCI